MESVRPRPSRGLPRCGGQGLRGRYSVAMVTPVCPNELIIASSSEISSSSIRLVEGAGSVSENPDACCRNDRRIAQPLGYLSLAVSESTVALSGPAVDFARMPSLTDRQVRGSCQGDGTEAELKPGVAVWMPRRELVEERNDQHADCHAEEQTSEDVRQQEASGTRRHEQRGHRSQRGRYSNSSRPPPPSNTSCASSSATARAGSSPRWRTGPRSRRRRGNRTAPARRSHQLRAGTT